MAISTAHEIIEYDICGSLEGSDIPGLDDAAILGDVEWVPNTIEVSSSRSDHRVKNLSDPCHIRL